MKIQFNCNTLNDVKDIVLLQRVASIIRQSLIRFFKNCTVQERTYEFWFSHIPLEIQFSRKMGKATHATAKYFSSNKIVKDISHIKFLRLSISRTAFKNGRKKFRDIIIHEIAHLLDYLMRFDSFHDEPWRRLCHLMGGSGDMYV